MTGLVALDIAIGIVFTLLIFSLFATATQEAIASLLRWRPAALRVAVRNLLGERFKEFWEEPVIESLKGPALTFIGGGFGKHDPSYIQPEVFAKTFLAFLEKELKLSNRSPKQIVEQIRKKEDNASGMEKRALAFLTGVEDTAEAAEKAIAQMYDSTMNRVTGWYVRRTQFVLFFIGLFMAVATNTDLVKYGRDLARNDALRAQVVQKASEVAALEDLDEVREHLDIPRDKSDISELDDRLKTLTAELASDLDEIEARTGWNHCAKEPEDAGFTWSCLKWTVGLSDDAPYAEAKQPPNPLIGWLLLAVGVMLGAQFWFDVLKRFVSLRGAVTNVVGSGAGKNA